MTGNKKKPDFEINEVVHIKGFVFKIVLIDAFTGSIGLKQISEAEIPTLNETPPKAYEKVK